MVSRGIRRALITLIIVGVLISVYTVAGFVGVPHLLRAQLHAFAQKNYGRPLQVGEIRFNPFTFALEVRDVSFADADRQPLVAFRRLFLDLDVASLWRRGGSFRVIELDQPFTRVLIRRDGTLNLADLAKPFANEPPDEEPVRLFVDRLRVTGGALNFEDDTRATPFRARLKPIAFDLRDFSTTEKTGNAYALQGASSAGERFAWRGTFSLEPLASRGRFELTQVQARTLWSYLQESLGFEVASGVLGVSGQYDFAAAASGVTLNLEVADVDVADLAVRPRGSETSYVRLAHVTVENTRLDLARARVDVGKARISGGEVTAWRAPDGTINLLELMKSPTPAAAPSEQPATARKVASSSSEPAAAKPGAAPRWMVSAPDLGVDDLKIHFEDRLVKPSARFRLAPVSVHVGGFNTSPQNELDIEASVGVNDSGLIKVKGTAVPDTTAVSAQIETKDIDLTAFQPYVGSYTQMTLQSGSLTTALDVELAPGAVATIKGNTEVAKLRTVDNDLKQDFIKWELLRAQGIEFHSKPARLRIATVTARAPYMRVIIAPDQTVNLVKVLTQPANAPPPVQTVRTPSKEPEPTGASQPMPVSVGVIRVTNGSANFADFWIQPNYAVSLQELNGSITGLTSERNSRAKVKLDGKVDRYAPALIEGDVNLLSASLYTDLKLSFKGVEMTSVTPYSGRFAGYRIERGKLSVDLAYHVENRQLKADQRFVIDQLQLGERVASEDAVRLPLRLAVALLKDRNGVIDLDLPVTGSLDDPQFRIGPIIWKAVVNLLTKVATAPFALLGRLFGGGEEMNLVDFEPGKATLDEAGQQKMSSLLKAMQDRPQLQLDVPTTYSPDVDRPVLVAERLDAKLEALAAEQSAASKRQKAQPPQELLADPAGRFEVLVAQYRLDFGADAALPPTAQEMEEVRRRKRDDARLAQANEELEAALREKDTISEKELEELGQARARAIQDALLGSGGLDASRVFVIAASAKPPAEGKVRLELSLK
jgi:uncharacterized protein DUF748